MLIILFFSKICLEEFFFKVVFCLIDIFYGILTKVRKCQFVLTFAKVP